MSIPKSRSVYNTQEITSIIQRAYNISEPKFIPFPAELPVIDFDIEEYAYFHTYYKHTENILPFEKGPILTPPQMLVHINLYLRRFGYIILQHKSSRAARYLCQQKETCPDFEMRFEQLCIRILLELIHPTSSHLQLESAPSPHPKLIRYTFTTPFIRNLWAYTQSPLLYNLSDCFSNHVITSDSKQA
jgi:hypothetical protein